MFEHIERLQELTYRNIRNLWERKFFLVDKIGIQKTIATCCSNGPNEIIDTPIFMELNTLWAQISDVKFENNPVSEANKCHLIQVYSQINVLCRVLLNKRDYYHM
jgi:hypothetical protein